MSIIQSIIASISASAGSGGGGGGSGGTPTFGSWTIEWWEKKLSSQTTTVPRIFACGTDTSASIGYSNESGGDYVWTGGTGSGPFTVGSIVNSWHHFSINSDGTNLYVYMDGIEKFNGVRTGSLITDASTTFRIGGDGNNFWKGRIADFHIMKGVAKYTNAGSYPSGRLTPGAGTVLLTACASGSESGPGINSFSATNNADNPWGDAYTSFAFNGTSAQTVVWNGNSIFALDA